MSSSKTAVQSESFFVGCRLDADVHLLLSDYCNWNFCSSCTVCILRSRALEEQKKNVLFRVLLCVSGHLFVSLGCFFSSVTRNR